MGGRRAQALLPALALLAASCAVIVNDPRAFDEAAPATSRATCVLHPTQGNEGVSGTIRFTQTKDGVLIEGSGSFSIDQQRYNGQFGGQAFWEIKNGKKTRAVTNVTYNAITTDFWGNLDAISGKESWEMHGTGGDAKGQPTQTNSISHGSPYLRIRKILVGAAYA